MKIKKSIAAKTVFIVGIIVSLLLAIMFLTFNYYDKKLTKTIQEYYFDNNQKIFKELLHKELKANEKRINNILSAISETSAIFLYNYDKEGMINSLKIFMKQNSDIKAIKIIDTNVNNLFVLLVREGKKIVISKNVPKTFNKYKKLEKLIYSDGKEKIGKVVLYYDESVIKERLQDIKKTSLLNLKNFEQTITDIQKKIFLVKLITYLLFLLLLLLLIAILINRIINKPLNEFRRGLNSFFNFFQNPTKEVEKIYIYTNDEFEEMAKSINRNIEFVVELHSEMNELIKIVDKYVMSCEIDDKGIIKTASSALCEISGYKKEELINKPFYELIHPSFRDFFEKNLKRDVFRAEIENIKKSGDIFWTKVIVSPKCNNEVCGYTIIMNDITDKKQVEDLTKHLELKVHERTKELEESKKELQMVYKNLRDSINFASMLQKAILGDEERLKEFFNDAFALWLPRDIVGGDIWFFDTLRDDNEGILLLADSTGHGIPGAFVTMIIKSIYNQIIIDIKKSNEPVSPAKVLSVFNISIKQILQQINKDSKSNAGFDGAVIYINKNQNVLKFAGANTPLFYIENEEIIQLKSTRASVGYRTSDFDLEYKEEIFELKKDMKFYITTDGYLDQGGGESGFSFGKKRLQKLLLNIHNLPFEKQKKILKDEIEKYQNMIEDNERRDDITILGFKI